MYKKTLCDLLWLNLAMQHKVQKFHLEGPNQIETHTHIQICRLFIIKTSSSFFSLSHDFVTATLIVLEFRKCGSI